MQSEGAAGKSLGDLYAAVQSAFSKSPSGFPVTLYPALAVTRYGGTESFPHEAGFDSYMTGVVFLGFLYAICADAGISTPAVDDLMTALHISPALLSLTYKMQTVRLFYDGIRMNGDDIIPEMERYLLIVNFKKEDVTNASIREFMSVSFPDIPFEIKWCNDSSYLIKFTSLTFESTFISSAKSIFVDTYIPTKEIYLLSEYYSADTPIPALKKLKVN